MNTEEAARRGQNLAEQGKALGDEFKNQPAAVREAAEAAHANANKK